MLKKETERGKIVSHTQKDTLDSDTGNRTNTHSYAHKPFPITLTDLAFSDPR